MGLGGSFELYEDLKRVYNSIYQHNSPYLVLERGCWRLEISAVRIFECRYGLASGAPRQVE